MEKDFVPDIFVRVGWLVALRIYVALVVFQPYRDLEAGPGIEPRFRYAFLKYGIWRKLVDGFKCTMHVNRMFPLSWPNGGKLVMRLITWDLFYIFVTLVPFAAWSW